MARVRATRGQWARVPLSCVTTLHVAAALSPLWDAGDTAVRSAIDTVLSCRACLPATIPASRWCQRPGTWSTSSASMTRYATPAASRSSSSWSGSIGSAKHGGVEAAHLVPGRSLELVPVVHDAVLVGDDVDKVPQVGVPRRPELRHQLRYRALGPARRIDPAADQPDDGHVGRDRRARRGAGMLGSHCQAGVKQAREHRADVRRAGTAQDS
jgi:hypothetical protein